MNEREAFVRSTLGSAAAAAAAGAIGLALLGYGAWALGVGVGAGVGLGNFWMISRMVARLGAEDSLPAGGQVWKGALVRFVLVGVVLLLALVVFRVHLLGLAAGLLAIQIWMVCHWLFRSLGGDRTGNPPGGQEV
ncbi:MAG: ATP synthase subunit I [Candidatus Methylomirabilota bacterium]